MEGPDTELVDRDKLQGLWGNEQKRKSAANTAVCPHPLVSEGFSIATDFGVCPAHMAYILFYFKERMCNTQNLEFGFSDNFLERSFWFLFL